MRHFVGIQLRKNIVALTVMVALRPGCRRIALITVGAIAAVAESRC